MQATALPEVPYWEKGAQSKLRPSFWIIDCPSIWKSFVFVCLVLLCVFLSDSALWVNIAHHIAQLACNSLLYD